MHHGVTFNLGSAIVCDLRNFRHVSLNKFYSFMIFSFLINIVILLLKCVDLMLFSLLKHYLDLYITDTALKISQSLYCFTTSISYGVRKYFPWLWDTGISDAIFCLVV